VLPSCNFPAENPNELISLKPLTVSNGAKVPENLRLNSSKCHQIFLPQGGVVVVVLVVGSSVVVVAEKDKISSFQSFYS
jgi:hypothetical protein